MHWEEDFRANMKKARESIGMTQTEMARQLKDIGLPFHQQTIQRVESGERPVRLDEAFAIAELLGLPLHELVRRDEQVVLEVARARMARNAVALREAIEDYERGRARFGETMDLVLADGGDDVEGLRAASLLAFTAERVLARWREQNPDFADEVFSERGYWYLAWRNSTRHEKPADERQATS